MRQPIHRSWRREAVLSAAVTLAALTSYACSGEIGAPSAEGTTGAGAGTPNGPPGKNPGGSGAAGAGSNGSGSTGQGSTGQGSTGQGSNGPGGTGQGSNNPGGTGQGSNGSGNAGQGSGGAGTQVGPLEVAPSTRLPRLSHTQWENTMRDLLRLDAAPGLSTSFPPDPKAHFDTDVVQKDVSNLQWTAYQTAAEALAKQVASDPAKRAKIVPANLPSDAAAQATAFVTAFGRRAFRRPLTGAEVTAFAALFQEGKALLGGDALAAGVELTLRAFLQSPALIYRLESSTEKKDGRIWLNSHEVASRLSYALWNSMPSDELLDAADQGALSTPAGVETWARNLLGDPRAADVIASYHGQLFDTAGYGQTTKSDAFPQFTKELEPILKDEARRFFIEIVAGQKGGLREVLTSPTTFVNDKLAPFYGLTGSFGSELKKVDLDPTKRAGVMTQIGFLSKNGTLTQSDPIHRGVAINLRLLCVKLTAPNMIPPLPEQMPGQTNRQRVEAHTNTCGAGCHDTRINPVGFAFEHYDTVGSWRDTDNNLPIDAKASFDLDGQEQTFDGAPALMKLLAESPQVHECYAAGWTEYALGRAAATNEKGWVDQLGQASREGTAATELLVKLAMSDVFRARADEGGAP